MSALKLLFIPALAAASLALGVAVFAAPGGERPGLHPGSRSAAAARGRADAGANAWPHDAEF
jgi:hypothetical protein